MSKHKASRQRPMSEKAVELEKANQRIDELSKEKESLRQILMQYQKVENKSHLATSFQNAIATTAESQTGIRDYKSASQFDASNNRLHTLGENGSYYMLDKGPVHTNSTYHERIKSSQPYNEYFRQNNQNRKYIDNQDPMAYKTENFKDEVYRLGQSMEKLYKRIDDYEKIHALESLNPKKTHHHHKSRDRQKQYGSSTQHDNRHHYNWRSQMKRKSPKKSYESTDSEDKNIATHDYSSCSSCSVCSNNNTSNDSRNEDSKYSQKNSDDSFCQKCQGQSSSSKVKKSKHSHHHSSNKISHKRENSNKSPHKKNERQNQISKEDELEQEAINLLRIIQLNPQAKLQFVSRFGNEELFLETLKKSNKSRVLLLQILKYMFEILNSEQRDFSQQLYSQNNQPFINSNNLYKKSLSSSQIVLTPISMPKYSHHDIYSQCLNQGNQQKPSIQRQESQSLYTGENLIRMLEGKVCNPMNYNLIQQKSSLKNSQINQNGKNSIPQNPIFLQSNLQLSSVNDTSQQNPMTVDQLQSYNNFQSKVDFHNQFQEKPRTPFQVELKQIQNRESRLKMQEYETQIENLEEKLKRLRLRLEDENKRKAQEEADRQKRQQEEYMRKKLEKEDEENLRKSLANNERKLKEEQECEKLRKEKEEYEKRLKQLKEEEQQILSNRKRVQEEDNLKSQTEKDDERRKKSQQYQNRDHDDDTDHDEDENKRRYKEKEEEKLRKQKEEDEEKRKRKQREEDERRRQKEYEDEQNRLQKEKEQDDERLRKLREKEDSRKKKQDNQEPEKKDREQKIHDDNYKVVPDYMKVTKNRQNYVKDIKQDYLRRSSSFHTSASNTPKSNSGQNQATLNPNWEKALNKFIDDKSSDFEENSPLSIEEPGSASLRKSAFANLQPIKKKSLLISQQDHTPKSPSVFSHYKNNQQNIFSDLTDGDKKKQDQNHLEFSLQYKPERSPESNRSSSIPQSQFGVQSLQKEKIESPVCQPIKFVSPTSSISDLSQLKSQSTIQNKQSESNIKSDLNLQKQVDKQSDIANQLIGNSQENNDEDEQLVNKILNGGSKETKPKQSNDNKHQKQSNNNKHQEQKDQSSKEIKIDQSLSNQKENKVQETEKEKTPTQSKKNTNQQSNEDTNLQNESKQRKSGNEENLVDDLEEINKMLEKKKQQKKATIILQAAQDIGVINEDKGEMLSSLQTGRAKDKNNQEQNIQVEKEPFNKDPDFSLISPEIKSSQNNPPPIFDLNPQSQKGVLSFNQVANQNSIDNMTPIRSANEQRDKSISQIVHNQSEDFSQLGIENLLINQQASQNQFQDQDVNFSNMNDFSANQMTPIDSAVNSNKKPESSYKDIVKQRAINKFKQMNPASSKGSTSTIKSDSKIEKNAQQTPQKPVTVQPVSTQPKTTSYLAKKQAQNAVSKVSTTFDSKLKTEQTKQNATGANSKLKSQQSLNIGSSSNINNKSLLGNKSNLSINNTSIPEIKQNSYTKIKANAVASKQASSSSGVPASNTAKTSSTTTVTKQTTTSSSIKPAASSKTGTTTSVPVVKTTTTKSSSYTQQAAKRQQTQN